MHCNLSHVDLKCMTSSMVMLLFSRIRTIISSGNCVISAIENDDWIKRWSKILLTNYFCKSLNSYIYIYLYHIYILVCVKNHKYMFCIPPVLRCDWNVPVFHTKNFSCLEMAQNPPMRFIYQSAYIGQWLHWSMKADVTNS